MLYVCVAGNLTQGGFGHDMNTGPEDFHARNCFSYQGWGCVAGLPLWRPDFNPRPLSVGYMIEEVTVGDGFLQVRVFAVSVMPPVVLLHSFNYHSRYIKSAIDSVIKQNPKNKTARYQAASCYSLTVDSLQQVYNFPPVPV